jgi:hypothetical protein
MPLESRFFHAGAGMSNAAITKVTWINGEWVIGDSIGWRGEIG